MGLEKQNLPKGGIAFAGSFIFSGILALSGWDNLAFFFICGFSAFGLVVVSILYFWKKIHEPDHKAKKIS